MAIFTITNGESTELAVVRVTPIIEDCFTIYEYIVTTNNGDNITIDLSGNHFQAKYFDNSGAEVSFSDTTTLTYNTYLRIRFLLLNSGITGVFSNATINIKNNTLDRFYENFVERNNDTANCYNTIGIESVVAGTNITVDNTDPKNPIVSSTGGVGAGDNLGNHVATQNIDMSGNKVVNSGVPVNNNDLITKIYGDTNYAIQTSGTFTPVLTSVGATYTYTTQKGIYNKVGKNVTFTILMFGINTSGTPSGQLRITGMPFPTSLDPITLFRDQYIFAGVIDNANVPIYSVTFSLAANIIGVLANQSLTDSTSLPYNNVSFTNGSLLVSGTYITD